MMAHTHTCPGGCGKDLRGEIFACPACTQRLPAEVVAALRATYVTSDWAGHARALSDGLRFYASEFARRRPRGSLHSGNGGDCA